MEEEEEWEERDDRGNLWARGREMIRRRGEEGAEGGGVPGVPLTAVWSVAVPWVIHIQHI